MTRMQRLPFENKKRLLGAIGKKRVKDNCPFYIDEIYMAICYLILFIVILIYLYCSCVLVIWVCCACFSCSIPHYGAVL